MAWSKIIGLKNEKLFLQKTILNNRLAGAYCFLGIEGIGKDTLALEFAKTANCTSPIISTETRQDENVVDTITACDNCKSCKTANNFSNQNIQYLFAMPIAKKITDTTYQILKEQLILKNNNPYHQIEIPDATQINIDSVRNMKKNAGFASSNSGHRFIIISNGDLMNTDAANAFLKMLEEPQKNTTIIITSSKKEKLLPTILSRCQQFYINPLSYEEIEYYIMTNYDKNQLESRLISTFSNGSITKALEFFNDDINALRNESVDLLRIALKRKYYRIELLEQIDSFLSSKDKKKITLFLNLLLIWIRDMLVVSLKGDIKLIQNQDLKNRISAFANGYPNADFQKAISLIENSIKIIDNNVDAKLIFISLFINLRKIFIKIDY